MTSMVSENPATPRRFIGSKLVLASHNAGKAKELRRLLKAFDTDVITAADLALPEVEESSDTFVGNAALKALAAVEACGLPALADDSGLVVAALDGAPGVRSARWAKDVGGFAPAMAAINHQLADVGDRSAAFVCALCLAWPDRHVETVEGRVQGTIVWPPRGDRGFGYDPVFKPDGDSLTFAEMPVERKRTTSHRARAFALLVERCFKP